MPTLYPLDAGKISIGPRHSRRAVPTKRSAKALAPRIGVRMVRMPSEAKASSKLEVNLASRSRIRSLTGCGVVWCGGVDECE
jgi:hypothetical protein